MEFSYKAEAERRILIESWARYTIERLQKSLDKKGVGIDKSTYFKEGKNKYYKETASGALRRSFSYSLTESGGSVSAVQHQFNYYGKFIDMGVGRGVKLESVRGNREIYSLLGQKGRAAKRWFSKTYYSESLELINLLSAKYAEQIPWIVKEEISQNINLNL